MPSAPENGQYLRQKNIRWPRIMILKNEPCNDKKGPRIMLQKKFLKEKWLHYFYASEAITEKKHRNEFTLLRKVQ